MLHSSPHGMVPGLVFPRLLRARPAHPPAPHLQAHQAGMSKVMLTVFKENTAAEHIYR